MVAVYTFSRTHQQTTEQLVRVFSSGGAAREQWALEAEMLIEPIGWDALWKLGKEFCKKFEVRFPCIACVTITAVDFDSLSARVEVLSVQHETVSLPETVEDVPLIELWPTIQQHEACVDAATTAEFIDLMRFFYNNIWMPWDDQDDKILLPETIEERMKLLAELNNGSIPNCVARSIISLRDSAILAHDKLKDLEASFCENDLADEDDSLLPPSYITGMAELTVRLERHMAQWSLYEKALLRDHYLAKLNTHCIIHRSKKHIVALWQGGSLLEFEQISKHLQSQLKQCDQLTITPNAEEGLALEPEQLFVCSKQYDLPDIPLAQIAITSCNGGATLRSSETRSCLLMLSEECSVRGLRLDCRDVSCVLVMRAGTLTLQHSILTDDSSSTQRAFAQGIVAMADAKILIEDTTFDNFYTGIVVHKGARVELRNCTLKRCGVAIQMYSGSYVTLNNTTITQCSEQSIRYELDSSTDTNSMDNLIIMANCSIGSGDAQKEVLIVKQDIDI